MAMASIDNLAPTKSLIDLSNPDAGEFGIDDYELDFIFDDILLIEYVDETEHGDVMKGGIVVPSNALNKAWRKGKVILSGPDAKYTKEGDIVVTISGVTITGKGKVKKGVFLNEERMFGICKLKDDNTESNS